MVLMAEILCIKRCVHKTLRALIRSTWLRDLRNVEIKPSRRHDVRKTDSRMMIELQRMNKWSNSSDWSFYELSDALDYQHPMNGEMRCRWKVTISKRLQWNLLKEEKMLQEDKILKCSITDIILKANFGPRSMQVVQMLTLLVEQAAQVHTMHLGREMQGNVLRLSSSLLWLTRRSGPLHAS